MSENPTKEMFAETLRTKFSASPEASAAVELELIELNVSVSTPRQEQFALLFRGPMDFFLPQMTYRMEHQQLGEFDLFLVPVGKDQKGFQYEAVFNRFIEDS